MASTSMTLLAALAIISITRVCSFELFPEVLVHAFARLLKPLDLTRSDTKPAIKSNDASVNVTESGRAPPRPPFLLGLQKFFLDPEESIFVKSRDQLRRTVGEENLKMLAKSLPDDPDAGNADEVGFSA